MGYKEPFTAKLKRWLINGTIRCTPRPPGTAAAPGCHADGRTEPPTAVSPPRLRTTDIQAPITGLNTRLAALDDDLDTTLRASPVWREHEVIGGVRARPSRASALEWRCVRGAKRLKFGVSLSNNQGIEDVPDQLSTW